ncbi:c-type cytochrome [Palleronia abyssalis]|uniref:Fructose dehydrogenase cytochrome subunit n=1 Tax=Palleronia abyssalis TaxID=1501240 RepID=A0A2R8BW47_9RHOB|nr:c-type cytochrome [Palleronia abyssalis]SPJ24353.1 Fructose dehydrogenase cytochrome subunit [Palleronia abyssalis]
MKRISLAAAAVAGTAACLSAGLATADVARGQYLVETVMGCGNCHTPLGPNGFEMDAQFSGRVVEDSGAFTAVAANITPASRIADWSDAELARSIREGVRPDGSIIGPPMPFSVYREISDDDLASIVAFLRTVPAVENDAGESEYRIPLPPSYGPPVQEVSAPDPGVTVEYGEYLTALAHCMECHSPMTPTGPDLGAGLGTGGFEFHGPWGTSIAPNITNGPDGLADYTEDELKAMITQGIRPDGSPMLPPMPYPFLAQMTGDDLDAIILYLRSLPGQDGA